METINQINDRNLKIEKDVLIFEFYEGNTKKNEIILPIGYEVVSQKFFKHHIPTVSEIDYAINVIEDELMSFKQLVNQHEQLVCSNLHLIEIMNQNIVLKYTFTRHEIEDLFGKYANISMGEPTSRYHFKVDPNTYAIILIIREIMHHLNFETINLSSK